MIEPGATVIVDVEKPAAGGRMLARVGGQIVLVWGAIPGERIAARVAQVRKGVAYADTVEVVAASADRRPAVGDWRCGGSVYAHVAYERQRALKGEIIRDALGRIGRLPLSAPPDVTASPEAGYRMRARLHARSGRIGFFREGSHDICDPGPTGQLLPQTIDWLARAERRLRQSREGGVASIELVENMDGSERVCHVELEPGAPGDAVRELGDEPGLTGLSVSRPVWPFVEQLTGSPFVTDVVRVSDGTPPAAVRLRRGARAFFQSNRFLLESLARHVVARVPRGPAADLYAGVGLFGLALAASGCAGVTLVEGDRISGADLQSNAEAFGAGVRVRRTRVEEWLAAAPASPSATFIVDPPRTGLSRDALRHVVRAQPARIVYVSCDPATFARDLRALVDAGYGLADLQGFDLFPNTAHVEAVAVLTR